MTMKKLACLCAVILILSITITACGFKDRTALTAEQFVAKMEAEGLEIVDAADQFEEGAVDAVYLAVGENYQIEFYVVPSVDQAVSAFNSNRADFEAAKSGASSHKSAEMKNYGYYFQTTSENYSVISRTDNTFIYVVADAAYKDEISGLISELGY